MVPWSESMILKMLQVAVAGILFLSGSGYSQIAADSAATAVREPGEMLSLVGPLPKTVKAATYLVTADIEVPRNKIVTIEEGTVFLFKNFTSLHVQGTLVAAGTRAKPIVFTSEYDKEYNPKSPQEANPFDWNGIYIHTDALSTRLFFCKVLYSVYGIIAETKFIRIDPATLMYNGKSNVVIESKEIPETGVSGQYRYVLSTKDAMVDGVEVKLLDDPLSPKRNWYRWCGLSLLVAGGGATVYQAMGIHTNADNLRALSSENPDNLNGHTSDEWRSAHGLLRKDIYLTIPAAAAAICGVVGFSWSFTF